MISFPLESFVPRIIFVYYTVITFVSYCNGLKGDTTCEKISACECAFQGGIGIDLSKFSLPWESGLDKSIYFQPCSNVPFVGPGQNECSSGAAICLYEKDHFKLLATPEEASFESTSQNNPIYLKYQHNNISTTVLLQCETNSASNLVLDSTSTPTNYILTLQSPSACMTKVSNDSTSNDDIVDHSLSTGSVLIIIFFVFALVYLGGGALVLRLTRGAEGKELIPNYDFWADLPLLVRDGATFLFNGCKAAETYDRI